MKNLCNVGYISQMPTWPTGCESVSTVMLLNYLDVPISVDDFISQLPKKDLWEVNGKMYGESPDEFFIGTPYNSNSFGCYANVIVNTINKYATVNQLNIHAIDISSLSTEEMILKYVSRNMPVIYWATIDLVPSKKGPTWLLKEGNKSFSWISNEHCMLLVGETEDNYIFNDPWNNNGVIQYPKSIVEQRHHEMRSMAVTVEKIV